MEILLLTKTDIQNLLGIEVNVNRLKCILVSLETLQRALRKT